MIEWQGIQIAIDGNDLLQQENECQNNRKQLHGNIYIGSIPEIVFGDGKNTEHLSEDDKNNLENSMPQFEGLLQRAIGNYKEMEVTFEVDKTKTPYHTKPYRIPITHVSLMKRVINEIIRKNSLAAYNGASEWVALTFGVPKKNDGVRTVTNFRKLNEAIKRNSQPMPTIQDMLHQCEGMMYATYYI